MFAEDEDGELVPVTREDLVRVWAWQKGKLCSHLFLRSYAAQEIEAKRREGWHAWETDPLMLRLN
jgi:hypothetical protein